MRHLKSQPWWAGFLLFGMVLLLTGCAGQRNWSWQHPDGLDQSQAQQALAFCQALANEEINRHDYFIPYFPSYAPYYDRHDYRDRRFFLSSTLHYQQHQRFLDRQRYFRICMTSKGWQKVVNSAIKPAEK